ncbi:MAG: sugar phosphate isomerase/epimerase [Fuerstiella sp.]
MKLSISARIAESFLSKEEATMSLSELADLAVAAGYGDVCMRASQIGIHSSPEEIKAARQLLDDRRLSVSMVTGDFDIVYNNDNGPQCLRNITPHLDLAESLSAPLIRTCIKTAADISFAQQAADEAAGRGIRLAHQCHAESLFETPDQIVDTLQKINRPNFGLIFEAANLDECGQQYGPDIIARLAPWIFNVYLQNQKLSPNGEITLQTWCRGPVSFDIMQIHETGGINFDAVFEGLNAVGYAGMVTVHQAGTENDRDQSIKAATQTAQYLLTRGGPRADAG